MSYTYHDELEGMIDRVNGEIRFLEAEIEQRQKRIDTYRRRLADVGLCAQCGRENFDAIVISNNEGAKFYGLCASCDKKIHGERDEHDWRKTNEDTTEPTPAELAPSAKLDRVAEDASPAFLLGVEFGTKAADSIGPAHHHTKPWSASMYPAEEESDALDAALGREHNETEWDDMQEGYYEGLENQMQELGWHYDSDREEWSQTSVDYRSPA